MMVHMSGLARIENRIGEFNTRKSRKLWELWPPWNEAPRLARVARQWILKLGATS